MAVYFLSELRYFQSETVLDEKVVIIGAGGHAKVCIELLRAMGKEVSFCVGGKDSPDSCLGVPVLKGDENLMRLRKEGYTDLFIAIGSNQLRSRLADVAKEMGFRLVNAISPTAVVSPSAKIGIGVAIMVGALINAEADIGDLAIINTGASIDHDCVIGRAVHIAPQSGLAGKVKVGAGSFLGVGCNVIPGVEIGENVTVGAGGVVISNIPSGSTAVGIPARVTK
jgi:UDP-perosamine 4-acetyltransferase